MNRLLPLLIASLFSSALLAGQAAAQRFDDSAPAAPATPQAPTAANPAQPAQPPGVLPPPVQDPFTAPPAGQVSSGGSVVLQGGGRGARAVIAGPGRHPGGGGFGQIGVGLPMMGGFGMGPGPDDPDMAKLIQSEHELERQSHDLMRKYSETEDQQVREKAKTALRDILIKQFDLQNQRRELELTRVEERLSKLREQLKKRSDARAQIVDQRLEHVINEAEGLGWTSPASGNPFNLQFTPNVPRPQRLPAVAR
ncbi:MAG: hypothetical protein WD894_14655 [Pirellulales bacterium]